MDTYKMPQNPKIVIFGNSPAVSQFVQNHFAGYNKLSGENVGQEGDQKSAHIIADSILRIGENFADGHVILNYPLNITQAQNLDIMIDGVNLAINFTNGEQNSENQDVLGYYKERGTLINFDLNQEGDVSQKLQDAILAHIKL
ncbi:hypothetical protein PPERSA_10283 [Pseudocohnilembus persalinus]|uniref:Uncharacterized protein n=1 Tax=Pseudocohnilembus persalinus TaxID=266149 RepID=A0A0V0R029_PSEPJ|nr:hypothetical protein PPERSA_10283 [Pseudocohnilembus persalinus]|eukprot:KRX07895.1 hypothetical protein PPERSA_10283 [Pseudocohnilembus persalinus]